HDQPGSGRRRWSNAGHGHRVLVSALREDGEDGYSRADSLGQLQKSPRIFSRSLYHRGKHRDLVAVGLESVSRLSQAKAHYLSRRWLRPIPGRQVALATPGSQRYGELRSKVAAAVFRHGAL